MHPEAYAFVERAVAALPFPVKGARVVECGSYNVNGSVHPIFAEAARYLGFDRRVGPDVDVACEAAQFPLLDIDRGMFDIFVSCGSIEHAPRPADITECAARCLRPGGVLILHGEQHRPHGNDGGSVLDGESYTDFTPEAARALLADGWEVSVIDTWQSDVYVVAVWTGITNATIAQTGRRKGKVQK